MMYKHFFIIIMIILFFCRIRSDVASNTLPSCSEADCVNCATQLRRREENQNKQERKNPVLAK